jgi:hypothetical protein
MKSITIPGAKKTFPENETEAAVGRILKDG